MFEYGVAYDLQFLRSTEWLRQEKAKVGGMIHLNLPEIPLVGQAELIAISPCPPIEPDDGTGRQVVTGLMAHQAANILDIAVTGLDEPLGVTTTHPIWSEDRQDFVQAGDLQVGEHLQSASGQSTQIVRITPHRGPPQPVYNLEINAEHVYHVAESGVLVHNAGCMSPDQIALKDLVNEASLGGRRPLDSDAANTILACFAHRCDGCLGSGVAWRGVGGSERRVRAERG